MKWPENWAPLRVILWRALWFPFIFVTREIFLTFLLIGYGYETYITIRRWTR